MAKLTIDETEKKLTELGSECVGEPNNKVARARLMKNINTLLDEWKIQKGA
jgi:hypothetical protein